MRRSRPPSAAPNSTSASPTASGGSPRWRTPTGSREFFPKGTDFSKVTREEVGRAFRLINDRPRKVLGYRTANEACWEGLPHSA